MIADDDTVVRDVVRRYLERDGLEVAIARDGNEALRLLGTQRIDVAVLDVMMPGPDGLALVPQPAPTRRLHRPGHPVDRARRGGRPDRRAGSRRRRLPHQAVQPPRTRPAGAFRAAPGSGDRRGVAGGADGRRPDRLHRIALGDASRANRSA